MCNLLPSGASCEVGWDKKEFVYGGYNDMRQCSCTCGAASGGSCSGAGIKVYPSDNCSGSAYPTVPANSSCTDASSWNNGSSFLVAAGTLTSGSCQESVVQGGTLTFMDAQVLCCKP